MKKLRYFSILLVTLWIVIIISSCETKNPTNPNPIPDISGDCSAISETFPDSVPQHLLGKLHPVKYPHSASLKGTYLLYSDFISEAVYLMNTKTGEKKMLNFQSMLPSNMKFNSFQEAIFCPYDDNKFIINLIVQTDTIGNNDFFIQGKHLFLFEANTFSLSLISPSFFGKHGVKYCTLYSWYNTSTINNNIVYIPQIGEVNLETGEIKNEYQSSIRVFSASPTGKDFVFYEGSYTSDGVEMYKFYLNKIELDFDPNFWTTVLEGFHFSQDGKYLLFTTQLTQMKPKVFDPFDPDPQPQKDTIPYAQKRFLETFIVDVDKTMSTGKMVLHKIVRYRRDLCLTGVYFNAKFLTPRSYVISYRYNNSELHQLHEISIDGQILGQVTR